MDRTDEHGDEPTADDLSVISEALRSAYLLAPAPEVEQRHLALMLAAAEGDRGAVVVPMRHRRRGMVAAGIVAATLAGSMGLAAAGVLPGPLQNGVAAAVRPIGLHIRSSDDESDGRGGQSPVATAPASPAPDAGGSADAPGHGGTGPGQSEDAPGHGGTSPGRSEDAPGHGGADPGQSADAPGHGGENPGQSDQAPGQVSDPGRSAQAPGQGGQNPGNATHPTNVPSSTTPPTTSKSHPTPQQDNPPPTSATPPTTTPRATPTTPAPKSAPGKP